MAIREGGEARSDDYPELRYVEQRPAPSRRDYLLLAGAAIAGAAVVGALAAAIAKRRK